MNKHTLRVTSLFLSTTSTKNKDTNYL